MTPNNSQTHHRRSIRLKGYDYSQAGAYFVTLCAWQLECLFGEVEAGEMRLSPEGQVASEQWMRLKRRFTRADFSVFVIMPNHVHGIVVLFGGDRGAGEGSHTHNPEIPPLRPYAGPNVVPGSLGAIVRAFKASVTWRIHAMHEYDEIPIWQRNYYEHIIRDDADMRQIEEYIQHNSQRWEQDQLHPDAPLNR
jgi:putative transposase